MSTIDTTPITVRRVWHAVTRQPHASVRELSQQLRIHQATVIAALRRLDQAGYVTHGGARGRTVVVPFVEVNAFTRMTAAANATHGAIEGTVRLV